MSTTNHSPLPWSQGMRPFGTAEALAVADHDDTVIAHIYTGSSSTGSGKANAALIVRAVNSHEALISALKRISNGNDVARMAEWANDALALAEGKEP